MQVSYPGVYVQEVASGARTITGVSTSVAVFVGESGRGPLSIPRRVLSYSEFERAYGASSTLGELSLQVRQFFLNGGQEAWIVRIGAAADPAESSVELRAHDGTRSVVLTAIDAGSVGMTLRAQVDYDTGAPDRSFNLTLYREVFDTAGVARREEVEIHRDLEMSPTSPRFVTDVIASRSRLVRVTSTSSAGAIAGVSASDRLFADVAAAEAALVAALRDGSGSLRIRVGSSPSLLVRIDAGVTLVRLRDAINDVLAAHGPFSVAVALSGGASGSLVISSAGLDVTIDRGAPEDDITAALGLGLAQGGTEVGAHAHLRPRPNGILAPDVQEGGAFDPVGAMLALGATAPAATVAITGAVLPMSATPVAYAAASPRFDEEGGERRISLVTAKLEAIARAVSSSTHEWIATVRGGRLQLLPSAGVANSGFGHALALGGAAFPGDVAAYGLRETSAALRPAAPGPFVTRQLGTDASDPGVPRGADYDAAFEAIDRSIDVFNLLILPRSARDEGAREAVWPAASTFCQRKRGFLLVDPPRTFTTRDEVSRRIVALRRGVVTDHAAVYWPCVRLASGARVDPSGSVAGLMARVDASRGVWKAPAGTEATLRGVVGVETPMSDPDNGVINPLAVNAIRSFPNGIVVWGARTLAGFDSSGADDYRYVPVRRLALHIEESLFRGLRFAVFEPNDTPLWRQIRLAAGAFMNNLFRRGAFAGQRAEDAYYVKCDAETTTPNDVALGIVNVVVGFAALKPAEFVVLQLQQMAGQVQT